MSRRATGTAGGWLSATRGYRPSAPGRTPDVKYAFAHAGGTVPYLAGRTRNIARPIARAIARRTGRSEADILSLMGAALLAMALVNFVRTVDTVTKAGRTGRQPAGDPPASGTGAGLLDQS